MADPTSYSGRRARVELADIIRQHGEGFLRAHRIPGRHLKVMQQIVNCRTEALGGHKQWCAQCGFERFLYHSCRNRHCPKCQTSAKEAWREARLGELLPVPYFHNVFTLPHELNTWFLKSEVNQRLLLNLLFESVSRTLLEFGHREMGGKVGFTLVLHTWDQQLRPHFHLHCLIASGALARDKDVSRWVAGGRQFLFPVRGLSKVFRAKFLTGFRRLIKSGELESPAAFVAAGKRRQLVRQLFRKAWVVYSKAPFAGPEKLLDYLSRYTHRVAISNSRLISCGDGNVVFSYRDRRDGDCKKHMSLPAEQFLGRFLQHVLPDRFTRIRHYGFLANRHKKVQLATIRELLGATPPPLNGKSPIEKILDAIGITSAQCPCCGAPLTESIVPSKSPEQLKTVEENSNFVRGPPK